MTPRRGNGRHWATAPRRSLARGNDTGLAQPRLVIDSDEGSDQAKAGQLSRAQIRMRFGGRGEREIAERENAFLGHELAPTAPASFNSRFEQAIMDGYLSAMEHSELQRAFSTLTIQEQADALARVEREIQETLAQEQETAGRKPVLGQKSMVDLLKELKHRLEAIATAQKAKEAGGETQTTTAAGGFRASARASAMQTESVSRIDGQLPMSQAKAVASD